MITEDYVSFEIAKLLKEKGYCNISIVFYKENGELVHHNVPLNNNGISDTLGVFYEAPTLQMATKWLRIKHNLHCNINYDFRLGWCIQIISLKENIEDHYTEMKTYLPNKATNYPSCEEAYKAAIKYCLENLI